jgi:hypothetical protein
MHSKSLFQSLNEKSLARTGWLYVSVLGILVFYIALMTYFKQDGGRLVAPCLALGVGAVSLTLQRFERDMAAMAVFVWGIWMAVTLQGYIRNGVGNAALFAYPAIFLLGGWILGIRQGFYLGVAFIVGSLVGTGGAERLDTGAHTSRADFLLDSHGHGHAGQHGGHDFYSQSTLGRHRAGAGA